MTRVTKEWEYGRIWYPLTSASNSSNKEEWQARRLKREAGPQMLRVLINHEKTN